MGKKVLYIIAIVAVAFMVSGWLAPTEYRTEKEIHVVKAGQTVWEIATIYEPKQDKRMSIGEFVHKIYKANRLGPKAYIQPGDLMIVPLEMEAK